MSELTCGCDMPGGYDPVTQALYIKLHAAAHVLGAALFSTTDRRLISRTKTEDTHYGR